jgi:septal ring factor EnvC (AmiA/AmiB activator)
MSDIPLAHAQSRLATWVRANVIATIGLTFTILVASATGLWEVSRWVSANENQIALNAKEIVAASAAIETLKKDIVSIDQRLNEARARVIELHTQSDAADQQLKSRLDIIDALGKAIADRAYQPPLPTPKGR